MQQLLAGSSAPMRKQLSAIRSSRSPKKETAPGRQAPQRRFNLCRHLPPASAGGAMTDSALDKTNQPRPWHERREQNPGRPGGWWGGEAQDYVLVTQDMV